MTAVRVFTETNITPERWMQDAAAFPVFVCAAPAGCRSRIYLPGTGGVFLMRRRPAWRGSVSGIWSVVVRDEGGEGTVDVNESIRNCCARCRRGTRAFGELPCGFALQCDCHRRTA